MRVGVVSDTHNNIKNIEKIIKLFNFEKVELVIHTGDISSAKALDKFSDLNCNLIGVFGNNDRNEIGIEAAAQRNNFQFQEPPKLVNLNLKKIAIFHEPDFIDDFLLKNKEIDIVVHGHTHRYRNEVRNGVMIFNPGECAGMFTGTNAIGILDLKKLETKRIFF